MRHHFFTFIVCYFLISTVSIYADSGWYTSGNFKPETRIKISLVNKLNRDREECPIIIQRFKMPIKNVYQEWFTVVDPVLPSENGEENGHAVPSQIDDLDKDGIWDELFFMVDFKARETKSLYIYIGRNTSGIAHHTHAEIGTYGRHIVPWWESEYMGWKLWFPDSADMYGRREKKLVSNINLINYYGHNAPYDAGIDIMLVGRTFGAGGICLFEVPSNPDSLSRPRFNPYQGKGPVENIRYGCDIVVNGSLRSIVRVHTMNWRTGNGIYDLEQYFTAYRNKNYYTCSVRYIQFLSEERDTAFGCGIRKMPRENKFHQENGIVISSTNDLMNVITPLDNDPGLKDGVEEFLGLALAVRDEYRPHFNATKSFDGNYTFRIPATDDLTYEYLIAGAWSEGIVLTSYEEFKAYILKTAQEYNSPIEIKMHEIEEEK